jgi:hypothetical protein
LRRTPTDKYKEWLQELQAEGGPTRSLDEFWFWVQSFLAAAANVSKLLWGTNRKAEGRRRELRQTLGVTDASPVRARTLRNHFEHLDERIEMSAEAGNFVGDSVMPSGAFYHEESMPERAKAQLRNFDPFTGKLSVWDDELDIDALAAELVSIAEAAGPVYGPITDAGTPED